MKYIHALIFIGVWGIIVAFKLILDNNPSTFDLSTLIGAGFAMLYFKEDDD